MKIIAGVLLIKLTKNSKEASGEMFYISAGVTSLTPNSKFCNFIL